MNKFLQFLKTAAAQWAMNSDPVVVQASGYVPTKTGVEHKPSEGSNRLSDNIAVISTIPNMLMNAGMTGIIPAIASEAGAAAGGYAGTYAGQKLDERFGTKWISPTLSIVGGLYGGYKGYQGAKWTVPYLPKNSIETNLVTKDFVVDAAADMLERNIERSARNIPTQVYPVNERVYGDPNKVQLIRKLDKVPDIDADGNVILVPEDNLFANFTTDIPFRRHTNYTTQHPYAIHFDATKVGNARPISTQPSDTFFLNGDIKIKPSDVTFVSGDPTALALAEARGFKVQPIAELQPNTGIATKFSKGTADAGNFTKIFDNYFENIRPTIGDYKALELKWGTKIPVQQLTDSNSNSFDFLLGVKDPLNFKHVIYHPAHPVESDFVYSDGIKKLFNNYHLSLGQHARYDLPIERATAKALVKAYLKNNPYENKEYFSSLTADQWDELFLRLRNKWEAAKPTSKQFYINKLQILRDNHAKAVAKRSGRILSKDSNGNFIFTDPTTGEHVIKSSAPITSIDNTRPFWTSIRLGIRDNLSNPDPKYVLFPAAAAALAAFNSVQQNPYKNETRK